MFLGFAAQPQQLWSQQIVYFLPEVEKCIADHSIWGINHKSYLFSEFMLKINILPNFTKKNFGNVGVKSKFLGPYT